MDKVDSKAKKSEANKIVISAPHDRPWLSDLMATDKWDELKTPKDSTQILYVSAVENQEVSFVKCPLSDTWCCCSCGGIDVAGRTG